jgi:hypothetical protein
LDFGPESLDGIDISFDNDYQRGCGQMDIQKINKSIIDEFRANGGVVGGQFAGATLLLLTTTGAKTGLTRVNPLV